MAISPDMAVGAAVMAAALMEGAADVVGMAAVSITDGAVDITTIDANISGAVFLSAFTEPIGV